MPMGSLFYFLIPAGQLTTTVRRTLLRLARPTPGLGRPVFSYVELLRSRDIEQRLGQARLKALAVSFYADLYRQPPACDPRPDLHSRPSRLRTECSTPLVEIRTAATVHAILLVPLGPGLADVAQPVPGIAIQASPHKPAELRGHPR